MKDLISTEVAGPETLRHEAEVRHILKLPIAEREAYLARVGLARDEDSAARLWNDAKAFIKEAREIVDLPDDAARAKRLAEVEKKRGARYAKALRERAWATLQAGP